MSTNREQYETACREIGIDPWEDTVIRKRRYGLLHAEPVTSCAGVESIEAGYLHMHRAEGIQAERDARDRAAYAAWKAAASPAPTLCACGAPATMSASMGPSCAACYDEISD